MEYEKTGNAYASVFTYKKIRNGVVIAEIPYNILAAFGTYPAISAADYCKYTYEQLMERANALRETIKKIYCDTLTVSNKVNINNAKFCAKEEDEMIGEIKDYAGAVDKFDATKWLICNGQELDIEKYTELFEVIGTTYGGDGFLKFALPNLSGRFVVGYHKESDRILDYAKVGNVGGKNFHALTVEEMPAHTHGGVPAKDIDTDRGTGNHSEFSVDNQGKTASTGSDKAHENRPPYMVLVKLIKYA